VRWAVGLALFAGAVVVPLLREQGAHPWQVMWAEDGVIYYPDALHHGVGALFRGSDGYVQFASRMIVAPAAVLPIRWAPVYVAFAAALFSALIAAFVFRATAGWIASEPMRVLVAAFYVLGPAAAWEQTGNATNAIWVVLAAAPWAIVSSRRSTFDIVTRSLVVVVAALSQPLALAFLPLAAAAVWRRRSPDAWIVGGALTAAVAVQGLMMAVAPPRHASTSIGIGNTVWSIAVSVLGSFLIGERSLASAWIHWGHTAAIAFVLVTAAVVLICAWSASARSRVLGSTLVVYAGLLAVAPIVSNGISPLQSGLAPQPIERYVFAPVALLVGALAVYLDSPDASRLRAVARTGRPLLIIQSVVVIAVSFSVWNPRSQGPRWTTTVQNARATCEAGPGIAQLDLTPAGWIVILPCEDIDR
jgi:hypothetical protein